MKLAEIIKDFPPFTHEFFSSKSHACKPGTLIEYARELRRYLRWYIDHADLGCDRISQLERGQALRATENDIREYIMSDEFADCQAKTVWRSIHVLRSFWNYYCEKDGGIVNPCPNARPVERNIPLDNKNYFSTVKNGNFMSHHQRKYFEKTRARDLAIFVLFAETGIRISELAALDINDISLESKRISTRNAVSYDLSNNAVRCLERHLERRHKEEPTTNALFVSLQGNRMRLSTIEQMVKKYLVAAGVDERRSTPKKLRAHTKAGN